MEHLGKTVAFIPVRGGSKSIPLKNIKPIHGRPLVYWVLDAAVDRPEVDCVVVSTDSDDIRRRLASRFRTASTGAFDLLQVIGRDCVGAVQLLPEEV